MTDMTPVTWCIFITHHHANHLLLGLPLQSLYRNLDQRFVSRLGGKLVGCPCFRMLRRVVRRLHASNSQEAHFRSAFSQSCRLMSAQSVSAHPDTNTNHLWLQFGKHHTRIGFRYLPHFCTLCLAAILHHVSSQNSSAFAVLSLSLLVEQVTHLHQGQTNSSVSSLFAARIHWFLVF